MKKLLKRISFLALAGCLVLGAVFFAACGEEEQQGGDENANYTVTVVSHDGHAVPDVNLTFGADTTVHTTDKDGKVTAELKKGTYEVKIDEATLPSVYALGETVSVTADKTTATVTLGEIEIDDWYRSEGQILYTVTVLYPDGTPAKGQRVQLCSPGEGGQCFMMEDLTNSRGESRVYLDPGLYEAQLTIGAPAGYTYDVNEENHYSGESATAEKPTVTIHLKAAE